MASFQGCLCQRIWERKAWRWCSACCFMQLLIYLFPNIWIYSNYWCYFEIIVNSEPPSWDQHDKTCCSLVFSMLEELYEILSCWPEELQFINLFIDSKGKRKRSSAGKVVLEKEQLFLFKAEASVPNYQKGFFVALFGWCWPLLLNVLFSKDAFFLTCVCLNITLSGKCRNAWRNRTMYTAVGFWLGAIEHLNFLGLFWTSRAGLSALYRVSCMSYKSVSQILTNLSVMNFYFSSLALW